MMEATKPFWSPDSDGEQALRPLSWVELAARFSAAAELRQVLADQRIRSDETAQGAFDVDAVQSFRASEECKRPVNLGHSPDCKHSWPINAKQHAAKIFDD